VLTCGGHQYRSLPDGDPLRLTHYHRNLLTKVPKSAQPWCRRWCGPSSSSRRRLGPAPSITRSLSALEAKFPAAAATWTRPARHPASPLPPRNLAAGVEQPIPVC